MSKKQAADFLLAHDDYEILTHANPDGDTLGSGFALCLALQSLGKNCCALIFKSLRRYFRFSSNHNTFLFIALPVRILDLLTYPIVIVEVHRYLQELDCDTLPLWTSFCAASTS